MISETSDRQDPKEDKNENEKENLITMFKRIHKFETNTEIEIRVYQGAVSYGHQWIQACNIISSTSNIRIVSLNCSEVNKNQLSEMDIINWLLCCKYHMLENFLYLLLNETHFSYF